VGGVAVAALGGTALYPLLATDRLPAVIAGVGGASLLFFVAALAFRSPGLVAWAIGLCGAEYAVFLGFRTTVDRWAPLVGGSVLLAAELGFRATEPPDPVAEPDVVVRSLLWLAGSVLAAVALGSILLAAAGGANAGLGFEALGVVATIATLAFLVGVVARAAR
jgi:hypothetical protein